MLRHDATHKEGYFVVESDREKPELTAEYKNAQPVGAIWTRIAGAI